MRPVNSLALAGMFAFVFSAPLPAQTVASSAPQAQATATSPVVTGLSSTASHRQASITFFLSNGAQRVIALRDGAVLVDGKQVATYQPGGDVERNWRSLVAWTSSLTPDQAVAVGQHWSVDGTFDGQEQAALKAISAEFGRLTPAEKVSAPARPDNLMESADAVVAEATRSAGEAARDAARRAVDARRLAEEIRNQVRNSVRVNIPDVEVRGPRRHSVSFTSPLAGVLGGALGLGGAFAALCAIAFGASFFAGRQIDVMADTVSTSFARSFFVGLFAQPLLIPLLGALLVGLTLTVVGILLIPFAIAAFAATLVAAVLGGYLAVARVAGSAWMQRVRGDHGREPTGILRSIAWGLAIVLAVWVPAVALSWVPAAGDALTLLAIAVTWALATTGFGAAVLTRGGVRTTFGRRFRPPALPAGSLFEQPGPEISTGEWMASGGRS